MSSGTTFQSRIQSLTSPERDFLGWTKGIGSQPAIVLLLFFGLSFLSDLLFTGLKGWPVPSLHDEFSYLLTADTFSHGRLTNPVHPFASHFETFHVLQEPSYASKYPPLPGAFLALGQLWGHPALGIFLGSSLTIAAVFWALRTILSPLATILAASFAWAQLAPYSFYSSSYMSGSVSAFGSCLLLGAAIRIVQTDLPRTRNAVILGLAVFILAASRPFEGFAVCIGIGVLLSTRLLLAMPQTRQTWLTKVILPGSLTLFAGAAFLLSYNHAVTGNSFLLPYSAYEATHSRTPLFTFGEPREIQLPSTPHLQQFEKEFTETAFQTEKSKSFPARFSERFSILLQSFIPFWFPSLLLLLFSVKSSDRWTWFSWAMVLGVLTASSFTVWFSRHYLGCFLPYLCLLACTGAAQIGALEWKGRAWGFHLVRLLLWSLLLFQILLTFAAPAAEQRAETFAVERTLIQKRLQSLPGLDLVLVSYGPHASVHEEWVYNSADIDHSEVIWAHSLGKVEDEKLIHYFSNRRIWRLQVDQGKSEPIEVLSPQPAGSESPKP